MSHAASSTTTPAAPAAPAPRARRVPVLLAAALVVVAAAAVLLDAPAGLRTPLVLLAVAATAARLAGHRRRGGLDAALVAVGGTLLVLVLAGLLLGLAQTGLGRTWWALGLAVPALLALAVSARRAPRAAGPEEAAADAPQRVRWTLLPWALGAAAVTCVALVVSVDSARDAETAPVQLSFSALDATSAEVTVSAAEATGPLELRTRPDDGSAVTYPLFTVAAGSSVTTRVVLPTDDRVTVTVSNPGQTRPLRTLVVTP